MDQDTTADKPVSEMNLREHYAGMFFAAAVVDYKTTSAESSANRAGLAVFQADALIKALRRY